MPTSDDDLRKICPGTSAWRALTAEDAARCIELHAGRWPAVFDEQHPEQHRPSMDSSPWFYDRDRRYVVKPEED